MDKDNMRELAKTLSRTLEDVADLIHLDYIDTACDVLTQAVSDAQTLLSRLESIEKSPFGKTSIS